MHVSELFFEVPRNYSKPDLGSLSLFGRLVRKNERPIVPFSPKEEEGRSQLPFMVYLEGGPGFGNREPQDSPVTRFMLDRGYQVLFLDYRGTGLSTPINAEPLSAVQPPEQAKYLKDFRADNIVRDSEAVRLCLTADYPEEKKKWSIFGQSFGGFVALAYLSCSPEGLREVFMTGGLAPVLRSADEVYKSLYKRVLERNNAYYKKFPEDVANVQQVARYIIDQGGVKLPGGGLLTVPRLLTLGISFGLHGGLDSVHSLILKMTSTLGQFGFLTRATLAALEQSTPFDTNPVYAILHEPIYNYKGGIRSDWAAQRVGQEMQEFSWLSHDGQAINLTERLNFSGEMIFPFQFDTYPELRGLKEAANIIAQDDDWDNLYDIDQLRKNEVPVYAASFVDDMFVDFEFARETASLIKGIKVYETNVMYHNAVRAKTDEVLGQLFRMRDDTID